MSKLQSRWLEVAGGAQSRMPSAARALAISTNRRTRTGKNRRDGYTM